MGKMRINHNISNLNNYRNQQLTNNSITKSLNKLSSGQRINTAGDDASGLAISEKMRGQIRGLEEAAKNIDVGISLIRVADGGLGLISDPNLMRLRELTVQAASDTVSDTDREFIQIEVNGILEGIDDLAMSTAFQNKKLLNGKNEEFIIQVGPNAGHQFKIQLTDATADNLGLDPFLVKTRADSESLITKVDKAINQVSSERSKFGAYENVLEHIGSSVKNYQENLIAAESRLRDVDIAKEVTELTSNQTILQAAQAMMKKANEISTEILQLLK
ncbi:flagellin [Sporosarcina highlanderae]|uniref:Flagellin n=1 Tax=Sporosarcina highlanderae TaxID=3035916 RepID=A0ABT8JUP6_9BACL|nr:flagellin [Sporosarcina highlanderae]MDN4608102.1 flagellin [Sporosarcina highlanderae]